MSMISAQEAQRAALDEESSRKNNSRDKQIVKTSIIGIAANVFLAAFKAFIGLASGSIAITMDAVNNISDAASSLITIVGTKLAARPADKKHPFGYGRIEYLSAMIISILVLYAGLTSLKESIAKIIHPETPSYTAVALVIVAVGVVVKIILGIYVKKAGERLNSSSLVNSGEDARLDSIISASTLAAAVIFLLTDLSLEAWLGAVISVVIIKSGIDMLRETLSQILGEQAEIELAVKIKSVAASFPQVRGVFDLILNNYGPDSYNGSLHVEVADTMTADAIDQLIRAISMKVYKETGVFLTAVSIYSCNTKDPAVVRMREKIEKTLLAHENISQVHGFYADLARKTIRFDIVVSFNEKDRFSLYRKSLKEIQDMYPDYSVTSILDTDFSEQ